MSEPMLVEKLAEAWWFLKGYWTSLRFAFQTSKGGWSDVDVLAYEPEKKILVICEVKVQGLKSQVYVSTSSATDQTYDYLGDSYLSILRHIPTLIKKDIIFKDFKTMVEHLTFQLVSNWFIEDDLKKVAEEQIKGKIFNDLRKGLGPNKIEINTEIITTIDLLAKVIQEEPDFDQGRRYGHPVLDLAREINRYLDPSIADAGRSSDDLKRLREQFTVKLREALKL